jgi:hypothetical protein
VVGFRSPISVASLVAIAFSCKAKTEAPGAGQAAPHATDTASTQAFAPTPAAAGSAASNDPALAFTTSSADVTGLLAAVAKYDAGVAPRVSAAGDRASFRRVKMDDAELVRIVASIPELSGLGAELRFFTAGDANAISQKAREDTTNVTFSPQPLLWSPDASVDILALTGRGKHGSFILALYPPAEATGPYKLASFLVFSADLSPVVLAYRATTRRELFWTTCWGCPGEQGGISFREDRHVVIVQH